MGQGKCHLGSEELGLVLWEHAHLDQVAEELTTLDEFHQEIDTELVLEDVLHVNQKWMVDGAQDIFFKLDVLHLLILQDDVLADALHCVELLGAHMLNKENLTKGTLANHLPNLEVL